MNFLRTFPALTDPDAPLVTTIALLNRDQRAVAWRSLGRRRDLPDPGDESALRGVMQVSIVPIRDALLNMRK